MQRTSPPATLSTRLRHGSLELLGHGEPIRGTFPKTTGLGRQCGIAPAQPATNNTPTPAVCPARISGAVARQTRPIARLGTTHAVKANARCVSRHPDEPAIGQALALFALTALAIGVAWWWLGAPVALPPSPLAAGREALLRLVRAVSRRPGSAGRGNRGAARADRRRSRAVVEIHRLHAHLLGRKWPRQSSPKSPSATA